MDTDSSTNQCQQSEPPKMDSLYGGKKTLFFTVCSDSYVNGLIALMKSIKKHVFDFYYDFKVVYHKEYCKLSDASKQRLLKYYPFKFEEVTEFMLKQGIRMTHGRFNYSLFLSFCAFYQPDYEQVYFLDSDMIVLNDKFLEVLDIEGDFLAVVDSNKDNSVVVKNYGKPMFCRHGVGINSGLMVIRGCYNSQQVYEDLIELTNKVRRKINDQEVINQYFIDKKIVYLPRKYNRQTRMFYRDKSVNDIDPEDCVLHFVGDKPWLGGQIGCAEIEKIWWDTYNMGENMI